MAAAAAAAEAAATASVCWEGVAARDERDGTNIDAGPARRIVPTPVPRSRPHSLRSVSLSSDAGGCGRERPASPFPHTVHFFF